MLSKGILFMVALGAVLFAPSEVRSQDNKALMHRYFDEVVNKGNLAAIPDFIAPTYIGRQIGTPETKGPEDLKQRLTTLRTAFPDLHVTVEDVVVEGDKVAVRSTYHGTQKGEFGGVTASGKELTWTVIGIQRVENGKFAEGWSLSDLGQRLRAASPPGQGKP